MIDFFIHSCHHLGIELIESEHQFSMNIPAKYKIELGGENFDILKEELVNTNYMIQRLAKLLSNSRPMISYGVSNQGNKGVHIYIWLKFTIYKSMKEEFLKGYCYHLADETIESVEYGNLSLFQSIEKRSPFLTMEVIEIAYEKIIEYGKRSAKQFIKMKQQEENRQRDTEINRIENYYSLLSKEHANAETADSKEEKSQKEEKEALIQEKEHLIEQQKIKHHIREEDTVIEPVVIVALEIK